MSKFWAIGGAAIVITVGVSVWGSRPVQGTEDLLAKAQSEFAVKAREALVARGLARASSTMVGEPSNVPSPEAVAHSGPAPVPPTVVPEVSAVAVDTASKAAIGKQSEVLLASSTVSRDVTAASVDEKTVTGSPIAPESAPAAATLVQSAVAPTASNQPSPKSIASGSKITPTGMTAQQPKGAVDQPRSRMREHGTRAAARLPRDASKGATAHDMRALRSRAPDIADAIARYL